MASIRLSDEYIAELRFLVVNNLVKQTKHPNYEFWIYNYTPQCQFSRSWTPVSKLCRGLILDADYNLIARPFEKFFNLKEHESVVGPLPVEPFEVLEKMDGSLGISYRISDELVLIATRGSFVSEQAMVANVLLNNVAKNPALGMHEDYTYLFEIIYPENRIVVSYGGIRALSLLAVINIASGEEVPQKDCDVIAACMGWSRPRYYGCLSEVGELPPPITENEEGYVLRFLPSNVRVKSKFEEYVRLHHLIFGINERHIWECLASGVGIESMLERVPDEFYQWVKRTAEELELSYRLTEEAAKLCFNFATFDSRRDTAIYFQSCPKHLTPILFAMLDNKPYEHIIWKQLRPEANRPFRLDTSEV